MASFFASSMCLKPLARFLWGLWLLCLLKTASDVNAGRRSHDIQTINFLKKTVFNPIKADG